MKKKINELIKIYLTLIEKNGSAMLLLLAIVKLTVDKYSELQGTLMLQSKAGRTP